MSGTMKTYAVVERMYDSWSKEKTETIVYTTSNLLGAFEWLCAKEDNQRMMSYESAGSPISYSYTIHSYIP